MSSIFRIAGQTRRRLRLKSAFPLLLPALCVLCTCSGDRADTGRDFIPDIGEALAFELSFGDGCEDEAYILADPTGIMVSENGDIYLTDERRIKVYHPDGSPKLIFSGEGYGPGELSEPMNPGLSPTGYITVMEILWEYSVFRPDYEFVTSTRLQTDPQITEIVERDHLEFIMMEEVFALDDARCVIGLFGHNMSVSGPYPVTRYLLYQEPDTLIEVASYSARDRVKQERGSGSVGVHYVGDLLWDFIDRERVVFTETWHERIVTAEGAGFRLFIASLTGGSVDTIVVPYEPRPIPLRLKERKEYGNEIAETILHELESFPPLQALRTDGDNIFCFNFNISAEEKADLEAVDEEAAVGFEIDPYEVNVIDVRTGRLTARARFAFIPDIVRGGHAYRIRRRPNAFTLVEKYRIDPAVYRQ